MFTVVADDGSPYFTFQSNYFSGMIALFFLLWALYGCFFPCSLHSVTEGVRDFELLQQMAYFTRCCDTVDQRGDSYVKLPNCFILAEQLVPKP